MSVARRLYLPFLLAAFVGAGCSKSPSPGVAPSASNSVENAGTCDPAFTERSLDELARAEAQRADFESIAKDAPEKSHFRRYYDAEIAFGAQLETKLAALRACGAAAPVLNGLRGKLEKSRANAGYLRESFPDLR